MPMDLYRFLGSRRRAAVGPNKSSDSIDQTHNTDSVASSTTTSSPKMALPNTLPPPLEIHSIIKPRGTTTTLSDSSIDLSESATKPRKVRFNLVDFEVIASGRNMNSTREWNRCWYNEKAMQTFKANASRSAQKVLAPDSAANTSRSWIPGKKQKEEQRSEKLRKVLLDTFQECRNIKNEQDMMEGTTTFSAASSSGTEDENVPEEKKLMNVDREALKQLYQESPDLVGLEVFVLLGLRGEASQLCRRVLSFVAEKKQSRRTKRATLYARTSQTISRPSRLYVRELAMAQAAALAEDEMR